MTITALAFPSARRGIAVGFLSEKDKTRPTAVVTSDGGLHWSLVPLKDTPLSLFFLNDTTGWLVTDKGIYRTDEAGRSWQKLSKSPRDVARVHFLDEQHGWAVGEERSVFETTNGGKEWVEVPAAAEPKTEKKNTVYNWIAFANPQTGMIAGYSEPGRSSGTEELPDWLVPDKAAKRAEWPHLSITLDTRDGGKTWKASTVSMFGRISCIRLAPSGTGLALIEFTHRFRYPCEVFRLDWKTGKSTRVFRREDRAVTDMVLLPDGSAFLGGTEAYGRLPQGPIPHKLKILRSRDLLTWRDMEVDYRATAIRVMLAAADERNVWAATDTGMILKLENPEP